MTWLTPALEALWSEGCGQLLEAALREEVERTLGELEKTSEFPVYVSVGDVFLFFFPCLIIMTRPRESSGLYKKKEVKPSVCCM